MVQLLRSADFTWEEKQTALHVLATASQNNLMAQEAFLKDGILDFLLSVTPPSYEVMYAIACACRGYSEAMAHFVEKRSGIEGLMATATDAASSTRLRQCTLRFLSDAIVNLFCTA